MKAITHKFTGPTVPITNYDQDKTNLGSLIQQYSGVTNEDKYAGPYKIGMARLAELNGLITNFHQVIRYSNTIDWIFAVDVTAAATRRVIFLTYNRLDSTFTYMGFITLTFPVATAHTTRGFRIVRDLYTTGTVEVNTTTVTGTGTTWLSDRMSVGSRIGFGSTDPTQITTWYEIGAINNDTTITLTTSAGTISAGTPYVIEDIILLTANTNATTTNGGLFVTKGIRPEIFTSSGTVIPAATTVDNIRAVYWLADASTVTNIATGGASYANRVSWTNQRVYCINVNAATTPSIFVYNFRAPLTLAAGKDVTTNIIKTGVQTVTGTVQQNNNGRFMTINHGPGSGVDSFYFVTTTRVYRVLGTNITNASTTFLSDFMGEVPPGSTSTFAATSSLWMVEYADSLDKLVITSLGTGGLRSYITEYQTSLSQFQHIFLNDDKQLDQSSADSGIISHPTILGSPFSVWSEGGLLYLLRASGALGSNQIYTIPIGAHQTYAIANNEMLITPRFNVSDSNKLYNVTVNHINRLGSDVFSIAPEPFKIYYRISGISDNSGAWTLLDGYGDLSGISTNEIQFGIIFKTIGTECIPARIMSITLTYEGENTDSHYTPSVANSSIINRIFAYRQSLTWGSNIPTLRIVLKNAETGSLLIDDDSISNNFGTFQYSINNGVSWLPWDNTQDLVGNYIRYTATSLPNGVRVIASLTQL